MKKTIQKIVQMVVVAAVMLPSAIVAEENNASLWKGVGGLVFSVGGVGWYYQQQEVTDCQNLINNYTPPDPATFFLGNSTCTNLDDLKNSRNGYAVVSVLGLSALVYGLSLEHKNKNGFQVRPTQDGGVEIERKGLSFSTNVKGESKLQKRWEF